MPLVPVPYVHVHRGWGEGVYLLQHLLSGEVGWSGSLDQAVLTTIEVSVFYRPLYRFLFQNFL